MRVVIPIFADRVAVPRLAPNPESVQGFRCSSIVNRYSIRRVFYEGSVVIARIGVVAVIVLLRSTLTVVEEVGMGLSIGGVCDEVYRVISKRRMSRFLFRVIALLGIVFSCRFFRGEFQLTVAIRRWEMVRASKRERVVLP